jgi:hypothetical protein
MALMKNDLRINQERWRNAVLVTVTLVGLAALTRAADAIYTTPRFHSGAMMVEIMRSRGILENGGVTGYYERLFENQDHQAIFTWPAARQYDRSFRIVRNKPNLNMQRDGVATNSFGLIGRECSLRKPANTRRVALLGSSLSMGLGLDPSRTFGSLLEDRLNITRPAGASQRFEVLNFSVAGYQLPQMLDTAIEDAPRFEPDLYLLDLNEVGVFRNWDEHLVWLIQLGIDPKYDFVRQVVQQSGASSKDDSLTLFSKLAPFRIPLVREMLTEMKSNAERHHASFLVVLLPSVEEGSLPTKRLSGIREILTSLDITFVDLLDTFDGIANVESLRIDPSDVHPNARGHAMIFESLYAKLQAQPEAWSALVGSAPAPVKQAKLLSTQQSH